MPRRFADRALRLGLASALLASAVACRSAAPPPPRLLADLALREAPGLVRRPIEVSVRDAEGAGAELSGLLVHEGGRYRLQLYPDVGARALELWHAEGEVVGELAAPLDEWAGGARFRLGPGEAPSTRVGAFARTLARLLAPVAPSEVKGAEREGEGWRLSLDEAAGLDVKARVDAELSPRAFSFSRFGASWTATRTAAGWRVEGDGLSAEITLGALEPLPPAKAELLELPGRRAED